MDIEISIFLDNEHHVSWVYNLQAEAEQRLKKLGYNCAENFGTGYHVEQRRRDWSLSNANQSVWDSLDKLLKSTGVKYTIEEWKDDAQDGSSSRSQ